MRKWLKSWRRVIEPPQSVSRSDSVRQIPTDLGAAEEDAIVEFFADPFVEKYSPTAVARGSVGSSAQAFFWCFLRRAAGSRSSALR